MKIIAKLATVLAFLAFGCTSSVASEEDVLVAQVQAFLAGSYTEEAHAGFWAEDLIYTSSAGARFGKSDIMQSFVSDEPESPEPPTVNYSGDQFDIRIHGDTAVVAFRLVGTPTAVANDPVVEYYFNTGTFLRRDGEWQAIAWQATKIPPLE